MGCRGRKQLVAVGTSGVDEKKHGSKMNGEGGDERKHGSEMKEKLSLEMSGGEDGKKVWVGDGCICK